MSLENCTSTTCLNRGYCSLNGSTLCSCPPCFVGERCEIEDNLLWRSYPYVMSIAIEQSKSSVNYRLLYTLCLNFWIFFGLINNILALQTFLCKNVRCTYSGIYLIAFTLSSFYSMLFLQTSLMITLYGNKAVTQSYLYQYVFDCYIAGTMNIIIRAASMWCSSVLAIERTLIDLFFFKLFGKTRKHSAIIVGIIFIFATLSKLPSILMITIAPEPSSTLITNAYSCTFKSSKHSLVMANLVFTWFNPVGSSFLHFTANILVLVSIARRKAFLSHGHRSQLTIHRSFYQELKGHIEYFLPPFIILLCQLTDLIPFQIASRSGCLETKFGVWTHIHLFISFILYVPQSLTFVLFVYPSKSYMKEFWKNSVVGRWIQRLKKKLCA